MKRLLLTLALAGALVPIATTAQASAAQFLGKREARAQVRSEVKAMVETMADLGAYDYWVQRAAGCSRLRANAVECDIQIYSYNEESEQEMVCDDAIRIVERRRYYSVRHPYEPDCWADDE